MRKSKRELRDRWLARLSAIERDALTADQPLRDDPPELNPKKRRGPPPGNQNRRIHGAYSRERRAFFAEARAHVALGRELLAAVRRAFGPAAPASEGSKETEEQARPKA